MIKPSPEAVERIRKRLAEEMRRLRGSNARAVIARMNPIIRGWSATDPGLPIEEVIAAVDAVLTSPAVARDLAAALTADPAALIAARRRWSPG